MCLWSAQGCSGRTTKVFAINTYASIGVDRHETTHGLLGVRFKRSQLLKMFVAGLE